MPKRSTCACCGTPILLWSLANSKTHCDPCRKEKHRKDEQARRAKRALARAERGCKRCGGPLQGLGIGRPPLYCAPCVALNAADNSRNCNRKVSAARSARPAVPLTCAYCKGAFTWKPMRGFAPSCCSDECRREVDLSSGASLRSRQRAQPAQYLCCICGETFTGRASYRDASCCGPECAAESKRRSLQASADAEAECRNCACRFRPTVPGQVYCTKRCHSRYRSRVNNPVRRARLQQGNSEKIDPLKVFDRDGWRCRSCGKETPRSLLGTRSSDMPSLDHIIPLSKGGDHSYGNTQCLCLGCNLRKFTRPFDQFLSSGRKETHANQG